MKRALSLLPFAALIVATSCEGPAAILSTVTPPSSTPTGRLIWADEFDGAAGTSPSATRWAFDVGTDWGNAQLEYDTARPTNVSLDGGGNLAIVARRESYLGSAYTSGRIKTQGFYSQNRGRFEARMKLPTGRGMWPAFWLLGSDIGSVGWPTCGEIDVMEYRGQEPGVVHGSLHGPGYSGATPETAVFNLPGGATFADGFHLFSVEWEPGVVRFFVDDILYQTRTPADLPPGAPWVFDHPFFLLLNVAVGGNWPGSPDGSSPFPQRMLVDYVRVYSR